MRRGLLAIFLLAAAGTGFSAEAETALLLRGPKIGKGLDFIGPNAIPYESGDYKYKEKIVSVYYVRTFIPVLSAWKPYACGRTALQSVPSDPELKKSAFFYDSSEGWSIFFAFDSAEEKICPFITNFLTRLLFFIGTSGGGGSPLPAFVEIK